MKYITPNEIDPERDYLLIGYRNRFGQLDVAKLKISLISSYYIPNATVTALSNQLDQLSGFLSSALTELSVTQDKITTMELSAYCSKSRLNEMIDERTFNNSRSFMQYLAQNFDSKTGIDNATCLSTMAKPLVIASQKIEEMFREAYAKKPEPEE